MKNNLLEYIILYLLVASASLIIATLVFKYSCCFTRTYAALECKALTKNSLFQE